MFVAHQHAPPSAPRSLLSLFCSWVSLSSFYSLLFSPASSASPNLHLPVTLSTPQPSPFSPIHTLPLTFPHALVVLLFFLSFSFFASFSLPKFSHPRHPRRQPPTSSLRACLHCLSPSPKSLLYFSSFLFFFPFFKSPQTFTSPSPCPPLTFAPLSSTLPLTFPHALVILFFLSLLFLHFFQPPQIFTSPPPPSTCNTSFYSHFPHTFCPSSTTFSMLPKYTSFTPTLSLHIKHSRLIFLPISTC